MTYRHELHGDDCVPEALERIADAAERIARVVDEWADANRAPKMVVQPDPVKGPDQASSWSVRR